VASFIDNVIVEINEKEEYDEIVEKIVKRIEKNNLYVKQENASGRLENLNF